MANKVILGGVVGNHPEMKETTNTRLIQVSIGTTEVTRRNDKNEYETQWNNVTFFGKQADYIFSHIKKGDTVYVDGKLKKSNYEKDGKNYSKINVWGATIERLKKGENHTAKPKPKVAQDEFDDDIPF